MAAGEMTNRPFRGPDDFAGMLAVRKGCLAEDRLSADSIRDPLPSADELAQSFASTPAGSPNTRVVEHAGEMIGYAWIVWWTEDDRTTVYLHRYWLLPAWRGPGIAEALLAWAEKRCRALAQERGATKPTYATNVCETEREKRALLCAAGYEVPRRVVEMRLSEPDTVSAIALPDGVEIRPLAPEQYRAIYALMTTAWAGLWGTIAESEESYQAFVSDNFAGSAFDPTLCQIAWHGEEAVSLALCQIRNGLANVTEIATHPAWKGQGLATSLLRRVIHTLHERGVTNIWIGTDAENSRGARAIYERVGFRGVVEHWLMRKAMPDTQAE
ncbi:MAG TPA: GNAT family N-acetyltransferase [Ktedonobacterales bacterium]